MLGKPGKPRKNLGHDIPVLLMVGRDDPVGGPRSVHKLADAYRTRSGLTDVTTLVYPDARHEIFNEVMQAESAPTCSPGSTSGSRPATDGRSSAVRRRPGLASTLDRAERVPRHPGDST